MWGIKPHLYLPTQLPANPPGRQPIMAQVLGFLPSLLGYPDGVPGSWFLPSPVPAVVDIWGVNQWMNYLPLPFCFSNKSIKLEKFMENGTKR